VQRRGGSDGLKELRGEFVAYVFLSNDCLPESASLSECEYCKVYVQTGGPQMDDGALVGKQARKPLHVLCSADVEIECSLFVVAQSVRPRTVDSSRRVR
jgi:hypothetical protein